MEWGVVILNVGEFEISRGDAFGYRLIDED